jgi:hypothetical protein
LEIKSRGENNMDRPQMWIATANVYKTMNEYFLI